MTKRNRVAMLAGALLIGAAGFGAYWLGMSRGMTMAAPGATAGGAQRAGEIDPATGRKILYWHDPMVPGQRFDKPGKSPFMDMMLVPVYEENGGAAGAVAIDSRVQQNLGIRTAEATVGNVAPKVEAVGSVAYDERDAAVVQARANGFLEKLHVRAPLDPVRKGQPLAELYVPDWVAAQEEFLAVNRMTGAGIDALRDGAKQRMRLAGISDEQIRMIESSGKVHPRLTLVAPIGGVVTELTAREGMTVMAGAPLFRINGLGTIWVNAEVPENLASYVRPGNAVEARTPALPNESFKGRVSAILPEVNAATRTLKTRIELANPSGKLVPGMFATVDFAPAAQRQAVLVPSEAIIQTGQRTVVVLADNAQDGKQLLRPVDVEIGAEADGMTQIRNGVERGQKVVVSGQFLVDSEANLKATETRLAQAAPAAGAVNAADGKVERVGKESVTISHGPVPAMQWGPMTMEFKLPREGIPGGIREGSSVHFEFKQAAGGDFEITSMKPAASGK